eukprot:11901405-Alexandrium_andersonii.AAC.1
MEVSQSQTLRRELGIVNRVALGDHLYASLAELVDGIHGLAKLPQQRRELRGAQRGHVLLFATRRRRGH